MIDPAPKRIPESFRQGRFFRFPSLVDGLGILHLALEHSRQPLGGLLGAVLPLPMLPFQVHLQMCLTLLLILDGQPSSCARFHAIL